MMKHVMIGLLAATALPAVVWATDQNINLTANVPRFCKFDANPTFSGLNNTQVVSASTSASAINVTTATSTNGILQSAGFRFAIQATCNSPSSVTLTTFGGGLKDPTPETVSGGTFLRRIDYSATATWSDAVDAFLSTDGTPGATSDVVTAPSAATGQLGVSVNLTRNSTTNSTPLAAGDYTDTLKISLSPQ